jgi:hypothetical protein
MNQQLVIQFIDKAITGNSASISFYKDYIDSMKTEPSHCVAASTTIASLAFSNAQLELLKNFILSINRAQK